MSKIKIIKGDWKTVYICRECRGQLSFHQMMNSKGTCPKCGQTSKGTVVDCVKFSKRKVTTKFGWKFWQTVVRTEYKGVVPQDER